MAYEVWIERDAYVVLMSRICPFSERYPLLSNGVIDSLIAPGKEIVRLLGPSESAVEIMNFLAEYHPDIAARQIYVSL